MKPVRALVLGDTHCGGLTGLCPPSYWAEKIKDKQKAMWDWYVDALESYGPFDVLLGMGDAVDGEGKKETLGVLEPDTYIQAEMAAECYKKARVKGDSIYLVRGTAFHVNGTYNYEDPFAKELDAKIRDEWYVDINGLKISTRHTVGRSNTPYGQGTPIFKEVVRDLTEAVGSDSTPADLILRGHAHVSVEMKVGKRMGVSVPCLQYPGSVYGRQCRGFGYHLGFGVLDITNQEDWQYRAVLMPYKIVGAREYECVSLN